MNDMTVLPPEQGFMSFCDEMIRGMYDSRVSTTNDDRRGDGIAFLLAQLGSDATSQFADLIATIDLTPPHAGILRAIADDPGRSQQALSGQLGLLPSRVVAYVDELEDRGFVERRRNPDDRRLHALHLTASGKRVLQRISTIGGQHERSMTAGLDSQQRRTLLELLAMLARQRGLTPHVHPGYRTIGRANAPSKPAG
jgi:DNA-binding MarR family transcriptional regulator